MIPRRLEVENYRGKSVPAVLGPFLMVCVAAAAVMLRPTTSWVGWGAIAGAAIVFAGGLADDLASGRERGLRGHLRALRRGKPTTGILKVGAVLAASAIVVMSSRSGSGPVVAVSGIVLIAGCANIWNGLDVAPGRALKLFLLFGIPLVFTAGWNVAPLMPALVVPACAALVADVRERAMLGDSGANLIGFAVGATLYAVLPAWGIVAGAAIALGLNLVAETITFTRVIEAAAPLGWFDRLGTLPERRSFSPGS